MRVILRQPKPYTTGEEIFNSVSHGIGALLAIAGTAVLIAFVSTKPDSHGSSICLYLRHIIDYSVFDVNTVSRYHEPQSEKNSTDYGP